VESAGWAKVEEETDAPSAAGAAVESAGRMTLVLDVAVTLVLDAAVTLVLVAAVAVAGVVAEVTAAADDDDCFDFALVFCTGEDFCAAIGADFCADPVVALPDCCLFFLLPLLR